MCETTAPCCTHRHGPRWICASLSLLWLWASCLTIGCQLDHNQELFSRSRLLFWNMLQETHFEGRSFAGVVLSQLTPPAEQMSSALRGACSRTAPKFFVPVVNLKSFFISSQEKHLEHLGVALWNSTCPELNDQQAAARNNSVILAARWRAKDYCAVRLWWWATRSVARRHSFTFLPKTRIQR